MTFLRSRSRLFLLVASLVSAAALAAGCGDDGDAEQGVAPPAQTPQQWAVRLVDWYLRDLNRDLTLLNRLNTPTGIIYITSGNPESVKVVNARFEDLGKCSEKLAQVGPPPPTPQRPRVNTAFRRIFDHFGDACTHYEEVSELMLEAVPLLSSQNEEDQAAGFELVRQLKEPSREGAIAFGRGLDAARREPILRAAGIAA